MARGTTLGADNGVEEWPTVRYYNLGEETFRETEVWPPAGVEGLRRPARVHRLGETLFEGETLFGSLLTRTVSGAY